MMNDGLYGLANPVAYNQGYGYGQYPNYPIYQQNPSAPMPNMNNALNQQEIQQLLNARPNGTLNLQIDQNDVLRSMCNHKNNGRDAVFEVNDGSGDVYCSVCGERWHPIPITEEELQNIIEELVNQMQNAKWVGELPTNIVREYFTMIPLLRKFPDLYRYASKNMERLQNQNGYTTAGDTSIYAQIDNLMGSTYGYNPNPYLQQQPNYYNQQPMYQYPQQPGYNPQGYGVPQQNPYTNPMQIQGYGMPQAQPIQGAQTVPGQPIQQPVFNNPQPPVQSVFGNQYPPVQGAQPVSQPVFGNPQNTATPQSNKTVQQNNKPDYDDSEGVVVERKVKL